jgi:hypothetical protein
MADNEITFAMDLEGSLKDSADADADALERLKGGIQESTEQLRSMQRAYSVLSKSSTANAATVKALKDRITASKAALTSQTEALVKMKGAFEKSPKPILQTEAGVKQLLQAAGQTRGPLGEMVRQLGAVKGLLGAGVIAAGLIAIAAGMLALTAAAAGAVAALAAYAVTQADARRSDLLRLEGLSKWRNYWLEMVTGQRRAADSAAFLQSNIDRVAASSPLARDRIAEMTGELYKAGLRGGRLQQALEGLAVTEAAQGKEAGDIFKARVMGAALYGTSIKKLSEDAKARLGGVVKAQMLSLDVQQRKLRESINHLFDGIKIERLLEGLQSLTELFSSSTNSGRALKAILEVTLQPLINAATGGGPLVRRFFQGVIIAALLLAITVLKVRNVIRDTFGGSDLLKGLDAQKMALYAGIAVFGAFATVVGVTAAGLVAFAGLAAVAAYSVYQLARPFIYVIEQGSKLAAWVLATDWHVLGTTITQGIAAGITAGAGAVWDAMKNMGSGAIKAFKDKLGIKSPSKVAMAATLEVPRGSVKALDAGRPMVKRAAEQLGAATEAGLRAGAERGSDGGGIPAPQLAAVAPAPRGAAAPQRGTATQTFNFGDVIVPGGSGQTPQQLKAMLREVLAEMLEGAAIQRGLA